MVQLKAGSSFFPFSITVLDQVRRWDGWIVGAWAIAIPNICMHLRNRATAGLQGAWEAQCARVAAGLQCTQQARRALATCESLLQHAHY